MAIIVPDEFRAGYDGFVVTSDNVGVGGKSLTSELNALKGQRQIVQSKSEMTVDEVVYMLPHVQSGTTTIDYYEIYQKKTGVAQPVLIGKEEYSGGLNESNIDATSQSTATVGYVKKNANGKLVVDLSKASASTSGSVVITNNADNTVSISNGSETADDIARVGYVDATVGSISQAATDASNYAQQAASSAQEALDAVSGAKVITGTSFSGGKLIINYADGTNSDAYEVSGSDGETYMPQQELVSDKGSLWLHFVGKNNPTNEVMVNVDKLVGVDGGIYAPNGSVTENGGRLYLTFISEGKAPIPVDVTSLRGVQGKDGKIYKPSGSVTTSGAKKIINFTAEGESPVAVDVTALQGKNGTAGQAGQDGQSVHFKKIENTDASGYKHVYFKMWEGEAEPDNTSANTTPDLMAHVNELSQALKEIMDGTYTA